MTSQTSSQGNTPVPKWGVTVRYETATHTPVLSVVCVVVDLGGHVRLRRVHLHNERGAVQGSVDYVMQRRKRPLPR